MRRRGLWAGACVVALSAWASAGCGAPGEDAGRQVVGVAMPTTTLERWVGDGENVRSQLEALGYGVDLRYAENDVPTQVEQIQSMVDSGVDALVVGAIDGVKLTDVLGSAAAADIPIISYDRLIRESPDIDYYATFDNARVGVQQGTVLLQGLGVLDAAGNPTGATGPFVVELFAGSPDDNNATVFYEGAMSVLTPYLDSGVLTVPSGQTDFAAIATQSWDPVNATARMQTLLPAYDGTALRLDAVLAPNDGIAIAVIDAVKGVGYGSADRPLPVVTGQDADLASARSVAAGEQYSTIYKDTRQLAEVTVAMVQALLEGTEPEVNDVTSYDNGVKVVPSYLLTPQVVTTQNYRSVLVDGGYYTAEELG